MAIKYWLIATAVCCVSAAGCSQTPQGNALESAQREPSAGSGTNPLVSVGHLASIEAADLTGDQRAMRAHIEAMQKTLLRDMRVPDPSRPIDLRHP